MKDNKPIWFGLAATVIISIVLVVLYANESRRLTETENQVQQLQAQLGEKDTKIKELEASVARADEVRANWEKENEELRKNIEVLGKCLDGVSNALNAESPAEVMILVGVMNEPCTKAEAIVDKLRVK